MLSFQSRSIQGVFQDNFQKMQPSILYSKLLKKYAVRRAKTEKNSNLTHRVKPVIVSTYRDMQKALRDKLRCRLNST